MNRAVPSLVRRPSGLPTVSLNGLGHTGLGALIGFVIAWNVFGIDFFRGEPEYWLPLWGDAGSGLAALRYFLDEPWGFPLLEARGLNSPDGINIAFTDSLPALALTAKVASPLGISPEQWFALWYLFIYTMQGLAAVVAVRAFGVRSWVIEASVAVIAVSAPIMMLRTWHPGLAGQFTLLLAWAIVGHLRHSKQTRTVLILAVALCVLTLLIHIYLLFAVVLIVCSAVLGETIRGQLTIRQLLVWSAQLVAAIVVVAALGGYFTAGASSAGGYFDVGMHLLGPVIPQWSTVWPGNEWTVAASGSFEAFNWLGAGWVLLLIGVFLGAIVSQPTDGKGRIGSLLERYQIVFVTMLLLTAYSVTPVIRFYRDEPHDLRTPLGWLLDDRSHHNQIYGLAFLLMFLAAVFVFRANSHLIKRFPALVLLIAVLGLAAFSMLVSTTPIDMVTGQFRSAGRLFWGVSYGLLVAAAVCLWRWSESTVGSTSNNRMNSRRAASRLAIVGVALIQLVDVSAFREHANTVLAPTPDRVAKLAEIELLVDPFETIHMEPSLNCVIAGAGFDGIHTFQDIGIVASWDRTTIDAVYSARQAAANCSDPPTFTKGESAVTLVVVTAGSESGIKRPEGFGCRTVPGIVACSESWAE